MPCSRPLQAAEPQEQAVNQTPSKPLILASASPRRRDMLADAGYCFQVVPSNVDESAFSARDLSTEQYAERLALAKARDVALRFADRLVLGADTVVDCRGQVIGKPADAADAERITRLLFSRPHNVVTGIALVRLSDNTQILASDTTTVYPRRLTEAQIAAHIVGGAWRDKAGAYAIQENGDAFIERIEGSFTNVIGLPMELLQTILADFLTL